jgi:hypothetical protein
MPFDPTFTINTIYPAANAAYLIMTVPNPALPPGYALVGALVGSPSLGWWQIVQALRLPSHGSGPGWFATPFLYDSRIHRSTPVYPDANRPETDSPLPGAG